MRKDIMVRSGLHQTNADAIDGTVAVGLTAAGTTNADALALTEDVSVLGTVATGTGARLPAHEVGDVFEVYNGGANALLVYPPAGVAINALTATTGGFSVAAGRGAIFRRVSATNIRTVYGA